MFLLFLVLVLGDWVKQIPMTALVAVMIMVSIGTFNWASLTNLRTNPKSASVVTFATVGVVVLTHDFAQGVIVGVALSALFFAHKVSRLLVITSRHAGDECHRRYVDEVRGKFDECDDLFVLDPGAVVSVILLNFNTLPPAVQGMCKVLGAAQSPPNPHRR